MTPGPVRWPWIASSVPSETFFAGVRFRGWMSEAEGFLCSTLPASLTWPARSGLIPLSHSRPSWPLPRSRARCRPARAAARPSVPPVSRITCISKSNRFARASPRPILHSCLGRSRCPVSRPPPGRRTASPAADVPRSARPAYTVSRPHRSRPRAGRPRPARRADSWQRIDGVSRLLPYSDLLALTSSSRRGEGVSDRGSWKRLRILLTGHVDAHAEPDIETGAVLIGPAWCLDR